MTPRDQISISHQSILWVAGMGVGLLTLAFVLGVQVGKQSEALRRPAPKNALDDLKDLPEPLLDQLKLFEGDSPDRLVPAPRVEAAGPRPDTKAGVANPGSNIETIGGAKAGAGAWTLQLVATSDAVEAKRIADKAKAAGFATITLKQKGQLKVRLARPAERTALDKAAEKLKRAGFNPFAVKAE